MNTFEQAFSRSPLDRSEHSMLWESVLKETWDPHKRITTDATGTYKSGVNPKGDAVYLKDERGEWDSKDGKLWVRRGSDGTDNFTGSVSVDRAGTITFTNGDTGVTTRVIKDGTIIKSLVTADGVNYSITKDSSGTQISSRIGDEEWLSNNGVTWTGPDNQVWNGNVGIDRFGQYSETPLGAEKKIQALSNELSSILEKQENIEKEWGVKITRPGEQIRKYEKDYTCRSPTEAELKTLEVILYRNQQMNVKNLSIAFVQAGKQTDGSTLWGSYRRTDDKGQIVIMPRHTEAKGWKALEGTLEHELVHHEQYENWGSSEWGAKSAPTFTQELNSKMGWRYDTDKSKYFLSDRDGKEWVRGDGEWLPIVDGKPDPKRGISSNSMQQIAKVRPSTNYFTNPGEMHAEGMSMFRMERQMLLNSSPQLYDLCKSWDQTLIDSRYGKANGKSRYIRNEKGVLVEGSKENTEAVLKAEEQWRKQLIPKPLKVADRYYAADKNPGSWPDADRHARCEHCSQKELRLKEFKW